MENFAFAGELRSKNQRYKVKWKINWTQKKIKTKKNCTGSAKEGLVLRSSMNELQNKTEEI